MGMQWLIFSTILCATPVAALAAYVSGVDDPQSGKENKIPKEMQATLDQAVLTYYKNPQPEKINTILDIIADSHALDRKTASAPMVGFFTVVFADNKNHIMSWISRNNYYQQAQYVIVNSLLHAGLKESALLFAKAHRWDKDELYRLRESHDKVDLKKLTVIVPGHIDTLWGAFFASGDPIYVNQIIDAALTEFLPKHSDAEYFIENQQEAIDENRTLAATTLREYARDHTIVRATLDKRIAAETNAANKKSLSELLSPAPEAK